REARAGPACRGIRRQRRRGDVGLYGVRRQRRGGGRGDARGGRRGPPLVQRRRAADAGAAAAAGEHQRRRARARLRGARARAPARRRGAGGDVLILRPVAAEDLDDLLELASQLDSVNLPSDREFLAERIAISQHSFNAAAGRERGDWRRCASTFVLEDLAVRRCVGTSLILAKNGRPEAPYYWLEVSSEERWSPELQKRFVHRKLRLRSTLERPTEVGGLILDPAYRSHPQKCGKALSIVRFAFISAHPERFERQLIAEMLSPFDAQGRNRLWDACGARFTGLPYREADHLSGRTKQFIADLFPADPVYVTLFPEEVQKVIGEPAETGKDAVGLLAP